MLPISFSHSSLSLSLCVCLYTRQDRHGTPPRRFQDMEAISRGLDAQEHFPEFVSLAAKEKTDHVDMMDPPPLPPPMDPPPLPPPMMPPPDQTDPRPAQMFMMFMIHVSVGMSQCM